MPEGFQAKSVSDQVIWKNCQSAVSFFSALRLQGTDYLSSLDEAFEIAIPRAIDAPIYCLVFCEHQLSSISNWIKFTAGKPVQQKVVTMIKFIVAE